MMHYFRVMCAAVAALFLYSSACAGELSFYEDEFVSVPWPQGIEFSECPDALAQKAGAACRLIGADGKLGAVFLTIHAGYALGTAGELKKHLDDSEGALANIPNVHVMSTRILESNGSPLMGMMEIIRKDGVLNEFLGGMAGDIRQSSLLIPAGNQLVQVFVYLSMDDERAPALLSSFMEDWFAHCKVYRAPISAEQEGVETSEGALSLMPRAIWIGSIIALVVILFASIRRRLERARRKAEDRKLQIQLEACSNTQADEDGCSDGEAK